MKLRAIARLQQVAIGSLVATISLIPVAVASLQSAMASSAVSQQPAVVPPTTLAAVSDVSAMTQSVFSQVNQYRQSKGLPPLKLDASISQQSQSHSRTMASQQKLSHDGFQQRASAIGRAIPLQGIAENVAYNMGHSDPTTVAVQGWIKSPGHRQNMEGNYNLTGIGIAKTASGKYYLTQIFVRRR